MASEKLTHKLTKAEFSKYRRIETVFLDTVGKKHNKMKWTIKKNPKSGKYTAGGYEYNENLKKYILIEPFGEESESTARKMTNDRIVGSKKNSVPYETNHIITGFY